MNYNPLVSVIVPCKNSEEFLAFCLHNIENQTYTNIEIIVVDNFSTDRTRDIASNYTDNIWIIGPERAIQDNFGIMMAKGSIVWLTGSDMRADKDYIEQGVKRIQEDCDAIYASVLTDKQVKHFWGRVKALERLCYIGDNQIESARFFRKDVWKELGGYDENLVGVEEDFQHRLDRGIFRTGRIKAREYHLHEEESLRKVFRKAYYYGGFMGIYLKKHKKRGVSQLLPIRKAFINNWKLLAKHPILTMGLIIYKLVQYTGGTLGCVKSLLSPAQKVL